MRAATAAAASVAVVCAIAPGSVEAQAAGHVAVVRVDPASYVPGSWAARANAASTFYATHRDAYDFVVLFPAFPVDLSRQSAGEVLGTHWPVRNDVSGIGKGRVDLGAAFGSPARLRAVIDVHSLVPGVALPGLDVALAALAHEVGHQWSASVAFRDPRTGQPSRALLGLDGAHWSAFLDSDASVMYGSDWADAGGGHFTAQSSRKRYSALDLYLMVSTSRRHRRGPRSRSNASCRAESPLRLGRTARSTATKALPSG